MGRPMEPLALYEELVVEAQSVGHELVKYDTFELSVIDGFRVSFAQAQEQIARGDVAGASRTITGCQAVLVRWFPRDLDENAKHREIARCFRGVGGQGLGVRAG